MTTVFQAGDGGNHTVRIPALATIGSLLVAFCEGRRTSGADTGEIVILAATSADAGATWTTAVEVTSVLGRTCGNPVPVVLDEQTVMLLSTSNAASAHERDIIAGLVPPADGRRVHVQHVTVPELAATPPRDITAAAKLDDWGWYATGPGHGLMLEHGPHRGRIVIPANHSVIGGTGRSVYGAHLLLSDDRGETWQLGHVEAGGPSCSGPNESSATQTSNGHLVVSVRNECREDGEVTRGFLHSDDGGGVATLDPYPGIAMPRVQSALISTVLGGVPVLLMSGPCDPQRRAAMALRFSHAGCATTAGRLWSDPLVVDPGPAAYSDLAVTADGRVHLLYECGEGSPYERVRHVVFEPEELVARLQLSPS